MRTYLKPEIVSAVRALQHVRSTLKNAGLFDAIFGQGLSANAYEADE